MSAERVFPLRSEQEPEIGRDPQRTVPEGIILERFKRMQTLPPHVRDLQDEFFVQSYLRRKRFAL
jgi:hypothetical protein